MEMSNKFYKNNTNDTIFWIDNPDEVGIWMFTFDKKKIFNMFQDYPEKLTSDEKQIFDKENPDWAEFFADRN